MLSRDYFYLPPPKYDTHRYASTPTSTRRIIGVSRHKTGDIVYRVLCEETQEIVSIPESQIKCDTPPETRRGFLWHLDFHFPNKWSYHVENFIVDRTPRPLLIRKVDTGAWRDNNQGFINWVVGRPKTKVDATLTLRTNDGWLIDSWHIYGLRVIKFGEFLGSLNIDIDYAKYKKSTIQWEDKINYEVQYHDCSVVATISRSPYGKRVKKYLKSFDYAAKVIGEMQERYRNISMFFVDASIQEEREMIRAEKISQHLELHDFNYL